MDKSYQQEARRVDTMCRIASDQRERDYWHGYRLGMVDAEPNVDLVSRQQRETGYILSSPDSIARRDSSRASTALGYWDGRRWQERSVRDFYQRLSVNEWLKSYGEIYGIASSEYIRQMCRTQPIGRSGSTAALPAPWTAEQSGGRWQLIIQTKEPG